MFNSRSIVNKTEQIVDVILQNNLSMLIISETWLTGYDDFDRAILSDVCPKGFDYVHAPRMLKKGGGLALLTKTPIAAKTLDLGTSRIPSSFELMTVNVSLSNKHTTLAIIYRPPAGSIAVFYDEFLNLLCFLNTHSNFIILGDFNLKLLPNQPYPPQLQHLITSFNLEQHVLHSTHDKGSILDLIFTRGELRDDFFRIGDVSIVEGLSDHSLVLFSLVTPRTSHTSTNAPPKLIRRFNSLITDKIRPELPMIAQSLAQVCLFPQHFSQSIFDFTLHCGITCSSATLCERLVCVYKSMLTAILDQYAPLTLKKFRRPSHSWWCAELRTSRRELRRLEREWRLSDSEPDQQRFKSQKVIYNRQLLEIKRRYLSELLCDFSNSSKSEWKKLNSSLGRISEKKLPSTQSTSGLATNFNDFFVAKIADLRKNFTHTPIFPTLFSSPSSSSSTLISEWKAATQIEVLRIIRNSPRKSCALDELPAHVFSACINELLPSITMIVNQALCDGMPQQFKHSLVTPLLKKPNLDAETLANYRPVSNLPFISKIIERMVASRITFFMETNELFDQFQSAYRTAHSCETAILAITNHVLNAIDRGEVTVLVLLDLSSAFDTVDHCLLLQKLAASGFYGNALEWIKNYLSNRSQLVIIGNHSSPVALLSYGVPQGSVLGPLLFTIYMLGIDSVIYPHGVKYLLYADDLQLYIHTRPQDIHSAIASLERCIDDVKLWLDRSKLSLNEKKTEMIVLSSQRSSSLYTEVKIRAGSSIIPASKSVRNLGVFFDPSLSFENHINRMCRSSFYQLRLLARLRFAMNRQTRAVAVKALVFPHVEYCSSLLTGVCKKHLKKIQSVLHAGVRFIDGIRKSDSITPHLVEHNVLPVNMKVQYRLLCIIYSAYYKHKPQYIRQLLVNCSSTHSLRSNDQQLLTTQSCRTSSGERSVAVQAPRLWNSLPANVRAAPSLSSFKSKLWIHLTNLWLQSV
jgi:hypothetical protein